jgi:hypothetical protein
MSGPTPRRSGCPSSLLPCDALSAPAISFDRACAGGSATTRRGRRSGHTVARAVTAAPGWMCRFNLLARRPTCSASVRNGYSSGTRRSHGWRLGGSARDIYYADQAGNSGLELHLGQQLAEARLAAKVVEPGVYLGPDDRLIVLCVRTLQPVERRRYFAEACVD